MDSDAMKNCRKKRPTASCSINGAHRTKKTKFAMEALKILIFFAFLASTTNVSAQIDMVSCGNSSNQLKCCKTDSTFSSHCLRKTFADRINDAKCSCAISNGEYLNLCKWNTLITIKTGVKCEMNGAQCSAENQHSAQMNCLPGGIYPPKEDDKLTYCAFTPVEAATATTELGNNYDEIFYNMLFGCWLHECGERMKLHKASRSSLRFKDVNVHWCYPKNFDGGIPRTAKEEGDQTRGITYCERYKPSTASCARPPLCDENGKIDRSVYMVPLINGKIDYEYCEKLCPEEMTGASDPEGGLGEHNNDQCLIVPVCEDTGSGEVRPHNHDKHFIPHCVPMCDTDGQPRKHNVSAGFTASTKTCIPLPKCDADGKPPPSGDQNRYNAAECASPAAPSSTSQAVETPFFTKEIMMTGGAIIGAIALVIIALIGIAVLIGFKTYPGYKRRRARAKKIKEFSEPGEFMETCAITDFHIKDTPPEFLAIERGTTLADLFTFFGKFDAMVREHGAKGGQLNFADYRYSLERAFVLYLLEPKSKEQPPVKDAGALYVEARWEEVGAGLDYIGAFLKMVQASKEEGSTIECRAEIVLTYHVADCVNHYRNVVNRLLYTPEAALAEIVHEQENHKDVVESKKPVNAGHVRTQIGVLTDVARTNTKILRTEIAVIETLLKGWKPADGAGAAAAATTGKAKEQSKERVDKSASNSTDKKPPVTAPAAAAPAKK